MITKVINVTIVVLAIANIMMGTAIIVTNLP